jgi:hypothetical protein
MNIEDNEQLTLGNYDILPHSDSIMVSLLDHLEVDPRKSVLGWLLTLSKEDLEALNHLVAAIVEDPEVLSKDELSLHMLVSMTCFLKRPLKPKETVTAGNLTEAAKIFGINVTIVELVRTGVLSYTVSELDEDWEFKLTPTGEIAMKLLGDKANAVKQFLEDQKSS